MKRRSKYLPKIVLCAVGDGRFRQFALPVLKPVEVEHEFQGRDERMVEAFEASSSGAWGSLTREDYDAIEKHQTVLYALSHNYDTEQAAEVAHRFLKLGRELLKAGAIGLKYESSGVAHSKERWLELADKADRGFEAATSKELDDDEQITALMDFWGSLVESYVQLPLVSDDGDYQSCGMHLLGQPDAIISAEVAARAFGAEEETAETVNLFFMFDYYLLAECPEIGMQEGQTFRMHEQSPRFRMQLEDCTGYEEDDFFFNPYGRWRFAEIVSQP